MKLKDIWEQHYDSFAHKNHTSDFWKARLRESFYAGAEAVLPVAAYDANRAVEFQAEIDHFKNRPKS